VYLESRGLVGSGCDRERFGIFGLVDVRFALSRVVFSVEVVCNNLRSRIVD
jgi:hypothetical protein